MEKVRENDVEIRRNLVCLSGYFIYKTFDGICIPYFFEYLTRNYWTVIADEARSFKTCSNLRNGKSDLDRKL